MINNDIIEELRFTYTEEDIEEENEEENMKMLEDYENIINRIFSKSDKIIKKIDTILCSIKFYHIDEIEKMTTYLKDQINDLKDYFYDNRDDILDYAEYFEERNIIVRCEIIESIKDKLLEVNDRFLFLDNVRSFYY